MTEDQLAALLAKLKEDAGLRDNLQKAADLDAAAALAKEAGFEVSQADLLKYQEENKSLELSDEELEGVSGGTVLCMQVYAGHGLACAELGDCKTNWPGIAGAVC